MSGPPRAEAVVDLDAVRANVAPAARGRRRHPAAGRGQGRRLRPRHAAGGPGGPGGRCRLARASRCARRRWRCAPPATPAGCCAGWRHRGSPTATRSRPGSTSPPRRDRQLAEVVAAARSVGRPGPAAAQGRHRAVPQRVPAGALAGAGGRRRPRRPARRPPGGDRGLVALRLRRRARPPRQRRAAAGLRRGARRGRARRARARGAAPGQLAGHADPARRALRPGPAGLAVYGLSPAPAGRDSADGVRAAARPDPHAPGWRRSSGCRRVPGCRTATRSSPTAADHARAGAASATATGSRARRPTAPRSQVGRRRARVVGNVCMDQLVVDLGAGLRRGGRATRWCCSVPATHGEPTAQDWADWTGTIAYEVVTRLGGRIAPALPRGVRHDERPRVEARARRGGGGRRRDSRGRGGRAGRPAHPGARRASTRRRCTSSAALRAEPAHGRGRRRRAAARRGGRGRPGRLAGQPDAGVRARLHPRAWTAGTSSARRCAAGTGWCSTTSAATAGPAARTRAHSTIEQLGRDLAAVLAHEVPTGPVVLIGHSMGGMTLMAFAEQFPEVVGRAGRRRGVPRHQLRRRRAAAARRARPAARPGPAAGRGGAGPAAVAGRDRPSHHRVRADQAAGLRRGGAGRVRRVRRPDDRRDAFRRDLGLLPERPQPPPRDRSLAAYADLPAW